MVVAPAHTSRERVRNGWASVSPSMRDRSLGALQAGLKDRQSAVEIRMRGHGDASFRMRTQSECF